MALKLQTLTKTGFSVNAYIRVNEMTLTKSTMLVKLDYYVATEYESFNSKILEVHYDITGSNPIAQAYEYLKTLDEFKDAEDV